MSSSDERALVARIAAHESWASTDNRSARTANAPAAVGAKFLQLAAGDPARAAQLRKAHFLRLALKSAPARLRKSALSRGGALPAETELAELDGESDDAA